jgi:hypothetical protein
MDSGELLVAVFCVYGIGVAIASKLSFISHEQSA